jgi:cytidine deaminase
MAALIYQGRRQISAAVNVLKSHPDHLIYYPEWVCSIHAEHSAVIKARSSVRGGTVYVARHGGENSKPCDGCTQVLKQSGVRFVVYMQNGTVFKMEL